MSELSDADLLRRSRSDPDAICVLYDRHCESLLAALLRRGNDREPRSRHAVRPSRSPRDSEAARPQATGRLAVALDVVRSL